MNSKRCEGRFPGQWAKLGDERILPKKSIALSFLIGTYANNSHFQQSFSDSVFWSLVFLLPFYCVPCCVNYDQQRIRDPSLHFILRFVFPMLGSQNFFEFFFSFSELGFNILERTKQGSRFFIILLFSSVLVEKI